MSNPLVLKLSLANLGGHNINAEEIYNFIEKNGQNIKTYQLDSGKVSAAAYDYIVVLNIVGSVASIASLLWMAYEKFIASKKRSKADTGGLYIHIDTAKGSRLKFWLGNDMRDKDIFIKSFTKKISKFRETKRAEEIYQETKIEVESSGIWIKRK